MCLLLNWRKLYTVNLYVFLSALYTLQYVPIVTILVNCIFFKKKKKKKKNYLYFGMGTKIPKLCHNILLSIFSLGKGGNPYVSKPYLKTKYKCAFCPVLSTKKIQTKTWMTHVKIAQNMYIFPNEFRTFPVTEGNVYLNPTQKDMNFGNAIILHFLGPENCQNPTTKDTNFGKLHSLTPAKMPAK